MNMYTITGNSISFRIDDSERDQLNEIANSMQTNVNQEFTNCKQVVFALITHCKQLESNLNAIENERNQFESNCNQLESELESFRNQPVIETKTIEVEKEVIKEVPISLDENQVLLNLHPSQKIILETIAERRFNKKDDRELNTVETQLLALAFNQQTLFNWAGNYNTYLKLQEFRKQ